MQRRSLDTSTAVLPIGSLDASARSAITDRYFGSGSQEGQPDLPAGVVHVQVHQGGRLPGAQGPARRRQRGACSQGAGMRAARASGRGRASHARAASGGPRAAARPAQPAGLRGCLSPVPGPPPEASRANCAHWPVMSATTGCLPVCTASVVVCICPASQPAGGLSWGRPVSELAERSVLAHSCGTGSGRRRGPSAAPSGLSKTEPGQCT